MPTATDLLASIHRAREDRDWDTLARLQAQFRARRFA